MSLLFPIIQFILFVGTIFLFIISIIFLVKLIETVTSFFNKILKIVLRMEEAPDPIHFENGIEPRIQHPNKFIQEDVIGKWIHWDLDRR